MHESANNTFVTLQTGNLTTELSFDLVIIADGIHSYTRALVLGDREIDVVDIDWGGWVVWAPQDGNMDPEKSYRVSVSSTVFTW